MIINDMTKEVGGSHNTISKRIKIFDTPNITANSTHYLKTEFKTP